MQAEAAPEKILDLVAALPSATIRAPRERLGMPPNPRWVFLWIRVLL